MMKTTVGLLAILLLAALSFSPMAFGETGHYVNGVEGIKAASLPPPGYYYRLYTVLYSADTMTDEDGDELNIDFDVTVAALVNLTVIAAHEQGILG